MSRSSPQEIFLDAEEEHYPEGEGFSHPHDNFSYNLDEQDSGTHIEVEEVDDEMAWNQGEAPNHDASFIARIRQRATIRRQFRRADTADAVNRAAAAVEAKADDRRRLQVRSLCESADASAAGLMPHLLRANAEQLDIQKRNQEILQDLTKTIAALTQNQTAMHRAMTRQDRKLATIETGMNALANQLQEIHFQVVPDPNAQPPRYEDIGDASQDIPREV